MIFFSSIIELSSLISSLMTFLKLGGVRLPMAVSACSTNFAEVKEIITLDGSRCKSAIDASHVMVLISTCTTTLPRADCLAELAPVGTSFDLCGEVFQLTIDSVESGGLLAPGRLMVLLMTVLEISSAVLL